METSALNASNVEQAFSTLVNSIFYKKMPKSVDNSSAGKTSVEPAPLTVPISHGDGHVEIPTTPKSFRLDKSKPGVEKKNGCC
jgi:hypothetical protein